MCVIVRTGRRSTRAPGAARHRATAPFETRRDFTAPARRPARALERRESPPEMRRESIAPRA